MAKDKIQEWSSTAGSNTDIGGINTGEGWLAANVNNAFREFMAQIAAALSGSDDKLITGTAGSDGQVGVWNADGDLIGSSGPTVTDITAQSLKLTHTFPLIRFTDTDAATDEGIWQMTGFDGNFYIYPQDDALANINVAAYRITRDSGGAVSHIWGIQNSTPLDLTASGLRLGGANARVTTVLDEDAMSSDSATSLATQQSIKAYVDSQVATISSGGWVPLGTLTLTSSTTLSGLDLSDYVALIIFFRNVSHDNASANLTIEGTLASTTMAAADSAAGVIQIELGLGQGFSIVSDVNDFGNNAVAINTSIDTSTTSITLGLSAGSFDNGTVVFYGVKSGLASGVNVLEPDDIGVTVQGYDADTLKADTDDNITAGFSQTSENLGTVSSGTETLSFATSNLKYLTNGGAFTLAPPASGEGVITLIVTNNASAGAIATGGWDSVVGTFDTTDGNKFTCSCFTINGEHRLFITDDSGNA